MKKNNILIIIVVCVVFLIYGFTIIIFTNDLEEKPNIGNSNDKNYENNNFDKDNNVIKNNYDTLIIGNNSIWKYQNSIWYNMDELENDKNKYYVYIDQYYYGKYYLRFINKWNLLDDNSNFVSYNGKFLAYSEDFNISIRNYSITTNDFYELEEINNITNAGISLNDLSINEKVEIDIDNNNELDKIVNVSNLDSINQEKYFNLCYVILNGKIDILFYENIDEKDVLIEPVYNIEYVLNINNKNNDSIIIQKGYFSESGETTNILYEYNNEKYDLVIK